MGDFRKFTDQNEYSGDPGAKLYKEGKIRFNKIAGQLWFRGCEQVEIHVDESDKGTELGFKPNPGTSDGTYSYGRDGEHGGHVSVRSVLSYYGIWHERMDESITIPVRFEESDGLVVVDLEEAIDRWGRPSMKNATN